MNPTPHRTEPPPPEPAGNWMANMTSISLGAGAVLVLLPSLALFFGQKVLGRDQSIGLPTVAIFGILVLLGALALVSTMFARLRLSSPEEALALPPGSIRAAIAMALIVLFALISVMLYTSLSRASQTIEHLGTAAKDELVNDRANHVTAVVPVPCPAAAAASAAAQACAAGERFSYTVTLSIVPSSPAVDFAKQLLTLIGTLMTSVVSFYFAARSADASMRSAMKAMGQPPGDKPGGNGGGDGSGGTGGAAAGDEPGDHEHGDIRNATDDKDLPMAKGGVAT